FASGAPRKSRSGPIQAHAEPQTRPSLSNSALTCAGSMWAGSSMGISIDVNPHFLKVLKSAVLWLVKGEVNRKVLMPNLIVEMFSHSVRQWPNPVKAFSEADLAACCQRPHEIPTPRMV